jgi:lipopolysaccharide/colanic/teichoic acid biosynthesis glycosyltransferase
MSLVGTRPPTIDEVEKYENYQRRIISIKLGLTGIVASKLKKQHHRL